MLRPSTTWPSLETLMSASDAAEIYEIIRKEDEKL
jgi:hypothetical protein